MARIACRSALAALLLLLLLPLLLPSTGAAKTPHLTAKVDRDALALGSFLTLYITMRDVDGDLDLGPLEESGDFAILARNGSTNISIVNFEKHVERTLLLQLAPQRAGRLEIPALGLDSGVREPRTAPIFITVAEVASRDAPKARLAPGEDVFLEASVSNPAPFLGQPILYTLMIHLGGQINNPRLAQPDIEGFLATELEEQPRYEREIDGRRFVVVEIRRLLTPLAPGSQVIGPATLQCEILRRGNSFFPEMHPQTAQSPEVEVVVRALPEYRAESGDPPFSGLIGEFELEAFLDKGSLQAGDSATLTVTLRGAGNLPDIAALDLPAPESFKVYKDTPTEELRAGQEGFVGEKRFGYALVPLTSGEYTLPPVRLTYFSPREEAYKTVSSQPLLLTVTPGAQEAPPPPPSPQASEDSPAQEQPADPAARQREVEFLHKDILPLKEGLEAIEDASPLPEGAFWLLLLAPGLGLGLALLGARLSRGEKPLPVLQAQQARRLLEEARQEQDPASALGLCSRALVAGVNARCAGASAAMTSDEARERLRCAGLAPEVAAQAAELLERLDSLRYGGKADADSRLAALEEIAAMLGRLRP